MKKNSVPRPARALARLTVFASAILLTGGPCPATAKPAATPPPRIELKKTMDELFVQMIQLRPFMVSDEAFSSPRHHDEIKHHLEKLANLGQDAKHSSLLRSRGLQISREILVHHLQDTAQAFARGNSNYARWMLGATASLCLSCHTQVPTSQTAAWTNEVETQIPQAFDRTEFYFMSRQFERAHDQYLGFLKQGPSSRLTALQIDKSLERLVLIDARMNQDPKLLLQDMESVQKDKKLSEGLRGRAKLWADYAREWAAEPTDPGLWNNPAGIETLAQKLMTKADGVGAAQLDLQTVIYARLSGFLDAILNTRSEDALTPKLLYWMGIADRHFPQSYFMSMGDLYLKDCMTRFVSSPTAKLCLAAYRENQTMAFSGSGGAHIPDDVEKDIRAWQKRVDEGSGSSVDPIKK